MDRDSLISPVEYREFAAKYWERCPLHVERTDSDYFSALISVDELLQFVETSDATYPEVQVVNANNPVSADDFIDQNQNILGARLLELHRAGATIIVSSAHHQFPSLADLCRRFSQQSQMMCQANAYLSPGGNQGFNAHYDTHDVFVLQIQGEKEFRFYQSDIELPFTNDVFEPDEVPEVSQHDAVTLSAGDTLYIPRGVVHDARASGSDSSLHITFGVYPYVAHDLLREMLQIVAERDVDYRRSIDLAEIDHAFENSEARNLDLNVNDLVKQFNDPEIITEALSRMQDEIAIECIAPNTPDTLPPISLSSIISINESLFMNVERKPDQIKLRLAGQVIEFGGAMKEAVEALVAQRKIQVSELPNINDEQRLALTKQLHQLGAVSFD